MEQSVLIGNVKLKLDAALDLRLEYDDSFPNYMSGAKIAERVGRDERWIQRQVRRGVATPALTLGERQYDRIGALRLIILARLQDALGDTSPTPFNLIQVANSAIVELIQNPEQGTILHLPCGGVTVIVRLPRLRELMKAA